jgi:hypothetical protein
VHSSCFLHALRAPHDTLRSASETKWIQDSNDLPVVSTGAVHVLASDVLGAAHGWLGLRCIAQVHFEF